MRETLSEMVAEGLTLLFDLVLAVGLTLLGIGAELQSAQTFGADTLMAAWLGYMGLIALYAGLVVFGQERLLGRLQRA